MQYHGIALHEYTAFFVIYCTWINILTHPWFVYYSTYIYSISLPLFHIKKCFLAQLISALTVSKSYTTISYDTNIKSLKCFPPVPVSNNSAAADEVTLAKSRSLRSVKDYTSHDLSWLRTGTRASLNYSFSVWKLIFFFKVMSLQLKSEVQSPWSQRS